MESKENLRQHTVCFTGHRDLLHTDIPTRLDSLLDELCQQGFRYYGAGGALGFDTLAAEAVLRAQERYPHIKLILVLPFPKQAESWTEEHRSTYEDIKTKAAKVIYTSDRYNNECYTLI